MTQTCSQFPFVLCQIETPRNCHGTDHFHRPHAPGVAMAKEKGVFVVSLTSEHRRKFRVAADANVLVLKNISDPDFLPLIKKRKEQGKVTVCEITDDPGALGPWSPDEEALIRRIAGYCDAIQVTSSRLKDIYGGLNPICRLFRTQVSHAPSERNYRKRNGFVIGWEESHGHPEDMAEVAEFLIDWILTRPDAVLYLMVSDPVWRLFGRLPGSKKRRFAAESAECYHDFLRHLDVGIGPLRDTPFNRARSDVEYLEYAAAGVVPVMRNLAPHTDALIHGETGFLYSSPQELVENLALLSGDPALLERVAKKARSFVLQNRLEASQTAERVEFYRNLLLKKGGAGDCHHLSAQVNGWASMDGAVANERHIKLEPTKFELLLREGLASIQADGDRGTSYRIFRRASAIEPNNYLPCLYGAPVSPNPIETLVKALALNPSSLKARIMLGDALAKSGDSGEALRWFREAAEIFPDFEIPYSRAASLLEEPGRLGLADVISEKVTFFLRGKPPFLFPNAVPAMGLHP